MSGTIATVRLGRDGTAYVTKGYVANPLYYPEASKLIDNTVTQLSGSLAGITAAVIKDKQEQITKRMTGYGSGNRTVKIENK